MRRGDAYMHVHMRRMCHAVYVSQGGRAEAPLASRCLRERVVNTWCAWCMACCGGMDMGRRGRTATRSPLLPGGRPSVHASIHVYACIRDVTVEGSTRDADVCGVDACTMREGRGARCASWEQRRSATLPPWVCTVLVAVRLARRIDRWRLVLTTACLSQIRVPPSRGGCARCEGERCRWMHSGGSHEQQSHSFLSTSGGAL